MFTIIICTYNGGLRIERVVECILNQEHFDALVQKVLIVDNCSTDNTADIIECLVKKNNRITYLYEPKPGLSNARLCGVNKARTPWIVFLDDDNFINERWLSGIAEFIKMYKSVGAFNGRVIPRFTASLTDEQYRLLKVAYIGLACTCYSEIDDIAVDEKTWTPFGAGLVILREPLVNLAKNGWLKSEGRKQNEVISGEDTEMIEWIKKSGFHSGFCKDVSMYHEIDTMRLEIEYLKRLYKSFGEAYCKVISMRKLPVLRCTKWMLIEGVHFAKNYILNMLEREKDSERYYRNQLEMARGKGYFHAFINSFMFQNRHRRKETNHDS